nr:hypothetical protein [Tanacetum cinerariifolium]
MTEKANACSGKIFMTVAPGHFGLVLAENDSKTGTGVLVLEKPGRIVWNVDSGVRAHHSHVAGISGQSDYGVQSVAL